MKFLSFALKITLLALVPVLTMTSCNDEPETARLHGTIKLDNATLWETWQDSGEVQLTLFPKFVQALPPEGKGWGDVPDNFFGPGAPGGRFALSAPSYVTVINYVPGQTEYEYEFEVAPGEYSALALGLRHDLITDPSLRTATLGVHWNTPNEVSHGIVIKFAPGDNYVFNEPAPSVLNLDKGDDVEINFRADFGFVNLWYQ